MEKIKFIKKGGIEEFVPADMALKCWGGLDDYTYSFVPEIQEAPTSNGINTSGSSRKVSFVC